MNCYFVGFKNILHSYLKKLLLTQGLVFQIAFHKQFTPSLAPVSFLHQEMLLLNKITDAKFMKNL